MKSLVLALLLALLGLAPAQAQSTFTMPPPAGVIVGGVQVVTSCGAASLSNGNLAFLAMDLTGKLCTSIAGSASSPYQYQSAGAGQYALAVTSVQTLTVPATALIAEICVETASSRYTTTGTTPTSTVGIPVAAGGCFQLAGRASLTAFQIIGSGATVDVEYFK